MLISPSDDVRRSREKFRAAVDKWKDFRSMAKEDYSFVTGKGQWSDEDRAALEEQGRPCITVNKIKPQINVLSGFQRLNRYDIEFKPRTSDDGDLCKVRGGVTKAVFDECDYASEESQIFLDGAICGLGWAEVGIEWDYLTMDCSAFIRRVSPFSVYPDPESRKVDFSDANHLFVAEWYDKEELLVHYPEKAEEIKAQTDIYDKDEKNESVDTEPLWYQKTTGKVRVVQHWYKKTSRKSFYSLATGERVVQDEVHPDMVSAIVGISTGPITEVYLRVIMGNIELESCKSPYKHGEFPYAPFLAYYYGEGDEPAGIVRDVKDIQREINKRRSQELHILNTQANSGWMAEEGAMRPEQKENLKNFGAMPGVVLEFGAGSLSGGKVRRIDPSGTPANVVNARMQAEQEIPSITGINEALLGTDMAASSSGKAIELKQKQAVTHIAALFDNLRRMKKRIAYLLWGGRKRPGIIPQYYTEQKVFRIVGEGGRDEFINVNQPIAAYDPMRGVIHTVMNDLSVGEFDIVISDTPSTPTQRISQFWSMVDAVSKLGIPGDLVFDLLIDLSDMPEKETVKQRWMERQQAAQEQMAMQNVQARGQPQQPAMTAGAAQRMIAGQAPAM